MFKKMDKGFTLIELMIVVAIVAVLAAIAYPSYSQYLFRSRRAEGRELLMRVAAAQERYYTNFNQYATVLGAGAGGLNLGSAATTTCPAGVVSTNCYYVVTTANGTSGNTQTFVLTATPRGVQATDACANLTRSDTGANNASGLPTNGPCW